MTARRKATRRASAPATAKKGGAKKAPADTLPLDELAFILVHPRWTEMPPAHGHPALRVGSIDLERLAAEYPAAMFGGANGRVDMPPALRDAFQRTVAAGVETGGPAQQAYRIVKHGAPAILDALHAMIADPTPPAVNRLSAIGNAVSVAVRRAVLLSVCEDCHWNLTRVSEALALGDPGNVTKALQALGLGDELDAARKQGLARPGRRPRSGESNP